MNLSFITSKGNTEEYLFNFENKKYIIKLTVHQNETFTEKIFDELGENEVTEKNKKKLISDSFYSSLLEFN